MKKMLFAAFAALLALVACDRFQEFTFVQLSDTQIGFIDDSPQFTHSDSLMKAAVDAVNALDPALVVITGDLVNEPYNPVQDSVYRVRKAELQPPVYEVPGNHDILPYSEENHQLYRGWGRGGGGRAAALACRCVGVGPEGALHLCFPALPHCP